MMPELTGYEVLEIMKGDAALAHIPVVMITAATEEESIVRCLLLGADDHLPEAVQPGDPARARRLVAGQEAAARRRAAARAEPRARARDRPRDPARLPARRAPGARRLGAARALPAGAPGGGRLLRRLHAARRPRRARPRRRLRQGRRRGAVHGALSQPVPRARRAAVRRRGGRERGAARDGAGDQRLHRAHARPREHVRHGVLRRARPRVGRARVRERGARAAPCCSAPTAACARGSRPPAPRSVSCPSLAFGVARECIGRGETLLAYTDGVVDARNPAEESYGEERLMALLTDDARRRRRSSSAWTPRSARTSPTRHSSTTSRCSRRGGSP